MDAVINDMSNPLQTTHSYILATGFIACSVILVWKLPGKSTFQRYEPRGREIGKICAVGAYLENLTLSVVKKVSPNNSVGRNIIGSLNSK